MKFKCPNCQSPLSCKDELAGKHGKCPKCGNVFNAPSFDDEWYYYFEGETIGPITKSEIILLKKQDKIGPDDYVSNKKLNISWVKVTSIDDFNKELSVDVPADLRKFEQQVELDKKITKTDISEEFQEISNSEIMKKARKCLNGRWGASIGVCIIYFLIFSGLGISTFGIWNYLVYLIIVGMIVPFFFGGVFLLGLNMFFLSVAREKEVKASILFEGFTNLGNAFWTNFLMNGLVFLWSILLIIPGIIARYSYAMTYYLMADDPSIRPLDAIRKSKQLMKNNRLKLFCLHLKFIGWFFLSCITFGIGFFYLGPYFSTSEAIFYNELITRNKVENENRNFIKIENLKEKRSNSVILGLFLPITLILFGLLWLAKNLGYLDRDIPWFPLILIIVGLYWFSGLLVFSRK